MLNLVNLASIAVIGVLVCSLGGCGDGGAADAVRKRRSNLQQLGISYLAYLQANERTAANAAELLGVMELQAQDDAQLRDAINSLAEGDIVMIWNGQLDGSAADADYVLGFEAGVPSTGGYVVMADGTVRLMTAKQFAEGSILASLSEQN